MKIGVAGAWASRSEIMARFRQAVCCESSLRLANAVSGRDVALDADEA